MAEVRSRVGRGAYNFAHKTCHRHILDIQNTSSRSATHVSSLATGYPLCDIKKDDFFGAESTENGVTDGLSHDSYTTVTPLFGTFKLVCGHENVTEHYYDVGLKECSIYNKSHVKNIAAPRCHSLRGTLCSLRSAAALGQCISTRAYSGNNNRSGPLYKTKTGYYEILEVIPTATQAQIKTAYYKQSFVYHPDRNSGSSDATDRFSDISEAYTVLGNKALRKKYDRGLLSLSDLTSASRPSSGSKDASGTSAKKAEGRRATVGSVHKPGDVYDFDNFIQKHYNEQLRKHKDVQVRKEEMMKRQRENLGDKDPGRMMEMGVVMMLVMAVALMFSLKRG